MECQECRDKISEYIDRELTAHDTAEIEMHLEGCAECHRELIVMKGIALAVEEFPRHRPGTEVILNISSGIHKTAPGPVRKNFGPVLDINELSVFLKIDAGTIEEYLDEIPCFELGGKLLFRRKSVEEWIERREKSFGYQIRRLSEDNVFIHRNIKFGGAGWKTQRSN